jgi:hypothetical protein
VPTEAELAAIAAALSVVLEAPVAIQVEHPPSAWAQAARQEAVGLPAIWDRAAARGSLAT